MRKTWLTIILVAFAAIAALPSAGFARNRMYHPTLGQFLQRDPVGTQLESPATLARNVSDPRFTQRDPTAQYYDGMNLYLYAGSDPVDYADPWGLWKIKRKGNSKAGAEAEKDDTVEKLAKAIGLTPGEFQKWLTMTGPQIKLDNGTTKDLTTLALSDVICPGEKVDIPNTILAVWAGWEGLGQDLGKFWVMWGKDVGDLKGKGFAVVEKSNEKAASVLGDFRTRTGDRTLHGFLFWGHGGKTALTTKESENSTGNLDYWLRYSDVRAAAAYRLAFAMVYACEGNSAFDAKTGIVSPNGTGWGGKGTIAPWPFHLTGPTVDRLLPAGAQGTNP
jgi:hypothetical protein